MNVNLKNEKPECFFPINQMGFVKKYGLDKELQVNYLSMQHIMVDSHFPTDLSKPIPRSQTVVHTCIIAAIYMGFKEIYLLGCDNQVYNEALNNLRDTLRIRRFLATIIYSFVCFDIKEFIILCQLYLLL